MSRPGGGPALVIHGHFYQPPREDPWTGVVPEQPSAAPFHDWNERITHECYGPLGAVELDGGSTVNLYEHVSFNMGPTLLSWLEEHHPDVYDRIIAADRASGRAIAQAHSHSILPLCNDHDLHTQLEWGIRDFRHRFGRDPEGLWMPETATSERVLAAMVEHGVRFTIVAPHQLDRARPLDGSEGWHEVGDDGRAPAIDRSYRWCHPDDPERWLDLVVYDGPLAQSLAFGDPAAEAIVGVAVAHDGGRMGSVVAATDGETFGHHRKGAERQLARVFAGEAAASGVSTPRLLDLLELRPATHQATVRTTAWSCAHGIGRWVRDCGCSTGGEEGWNQAWREPLRNALDRFRDWGSEVMDRRGPELLVDQWAARDAYVDVLIGARSWDDWASEHVRGDHHRALTLLEAQRFGLLMYTSCGWFFNDLAGIETVQILQYAARSMDLYRELGEVPEVELFLDELARARSNDPAAGDGRQVWHERVDGARPAT